MPLNGVNAPKTAVLPGQLDRTGGSLVLSGRQGEGGSWLPDPGVPFLAEVLERDGTRLLLAVAGRLLRAETALNLEPGTTVRLTVREAAPERITLGLVPPGSETSSGTGPASATASDAASLLPDPEAPLPADQALARAVAFLLARGGPLSQEAVESLAPFFAGTADLAETLVVLEKLLAAVPTQDQTPLLADLAERLRAALVAVQVRAEAGAPSEVAESLAAAVRSLGLDHEARLARDLLDAADLQTASRWSPGHLAAAAETVSQGPVSALQDDLKGLLFLLQRALKTQAEPAPLQAQPQVQAQATQPPAGFDASAGQGPLARVVEEALHNLTGQRLLAPADAGANQERLALYLQLPVVVGENRHTAELRIYRESGHRKGARRGHSADLRLSCRLTTARLGPVRVDLAIRSRGTGEAHLFLGSDQVIELFRAREGEFREALTQAGLPLGRVTYALLPSPPPSPPAFGAPGAAGFGTADGPAVRPGAVDLRL
ncbi:MAG TPA: flagellar hook-length control protein FliK [Firmicutes bacterium]|nr:flagellar hook-length control protein FliK [Bacillota bacterium]